MQKEDIYTKEVPLDILIQPIKNAKLRINHNRSDVQEPSFNRSEVIGNYFDAIGIKPDQPKPYLALELLESTAAKQHLDRARVGDLVSTAANGLYKQATKNQSLAGRLSNVIVYHPKALSPGKTLKLARVAIQEELKEAKLTAGKLFSEQLYGAFLAEPIEVASNIASVVKDSFKKMYK